MEEAADPQSQEYSDDRVQRSLNVEHTDDVADDDIYRGSESVPRFRLPELDRSASSQSSSSASSSSAGVLRFSHIASTIEHAISRWARGRRRHGSSGSSSVTSSSSSSSTSSSSTNARSNARLRRRKSSAASLHSFATTLTTRRQAREAARTIPREFILYLPPDPSIRLKPPVSPQATQAEIEQTHVLRTPSLKLILTRLNVAMKRGSKVPMVARGYQATDGATPPTPKKNTIKTRNRVEFAEPEKEGEPTPMDQKKGKGKARDIPRQFFWQEKQTAMKSSDEDRRSAWWLDVASPTWDDMKSIGKLLQLHPLTLEDILQKESREKFEIFPRLGYYFVVFRAIEIPNKMRDMDEAASVASDYAHAAVNVVEATNAYFVVFKEGICTFHFEDISLHSETIRKKALQLQATMNMSSDWIAHGLMDSIVDSFFPVLKEIENEVEAVEDLVAGMDTQWGAEGEMGITAQTTRDTRETLVNDTDVTPEKAMAAEMEKYSDSRQESSPSRKGGWSLLTHPIRYFKAPTDKKEKPLSRRLRYLRRMTATRRLVTSLSRLLSSKADVVSQLRKRLQNNDEVAIYLGDVQDHIITIHQSLAHYERMLSHSHPAYLAHLRVSLSEAKGGMDKALVSLTVVMVVVLAMQGVLTLGGVNIRVPRTESNFTAFGVMLAISVIVGGSVVGLARFWWVRSKGGRGKMEEILQY